MTATESSTSTYQPEHVVAHLRALADRTGGPEGSRRLAWTPEWLAARALLRESLATLPVEVDTDEAGNLWAVLRGERPDMLVVGSHLDSVPKGGWLDGALGVMAGLELLRALAAEGTPPVSVALVDWADEEGARFSRSLFGSAASVGTLDIDVLRGLTDKEGNKLPEILAQHGVDIDKLDGARTRMADVKAYVEVHIEQGPILESIGKGICTVTGTKGIERERLIFRGAARQLPRRIAIRAGHRRNRRASPGRHHRRPCAVLARCGHRGCGRDPHHHGHAPHLGRLLGGDVHRGP